jgi:hypothetical protein
MWPLKPRRLNEVFEVLMIKAMRLPGVLLVVTVWAGIISFQSLAQPAVKTHERSRAGEELEIRAWPLPEPCRPVAEGEKRMAAALASIRAESAARRLEAIASLTAICLPAGLEAVTGALSDSDPTVRRAAIEAIAKMRDLRVVQPAQPPEPSADPLIDRLISLARDPDWQVRAVLTRTLASFQVYQASNTVLNLMANPGAQKILDEQDLRVRCQAILMVNQLRDVRFSRKSIGFLATFADYPEPHLRDIAGQTVIELEKTRNGYHELVGIARKPGAPQLRIMAIQWLARWKREGVRSVLEEIAATEVNPRVREVAALTLQSLVK